MQPATVDVIPTSSQQEAEIVHQDNIYGLYSCCKLVLRYTRSRI